MDTNPLRQAYDALLAADPRAVPPPGEWNTEQILAHVSLVSAATISTVAVVASGAISTYDNRPSQNPWALDRVIEAAPRCGTRLRFTSRPTPARAARRGECLTAEWEPPPDTGKAW